MHNIHSKLYNYIKGESSPEEKREIILWLEEDSEHIREYLNLRRLYDLNIWTIDHDSSLTSSSKRKKIISFRTISFEFLKIASVLLIGILLNKLWISANDIEVEFQTIYVPPGQRTEIFLSDGTQVWLNSGTTFKFPSQFTKKSREVELDGEAYMKVAKNEKLPFVVSAGRYDVKVLGTEFNLKSYPQRDIFETALLKGNVEVRIPDYTHAILLKPHEFISKTDEGFKKGKINDFNYFKWREGLLCFENEKVESLFTKLELYYDTKIVVNNKSLLSYTYSGKFRIRDGIEHVLKVLQVKHKFRYTRNDENNTIVIE